MMKNVVVTGATSFIGFPLVKALLEKGYSVFAVVRPNSKSHQKLNSILSNALTIVECDMDNYNTLKDKISSKVDIVMHIAWNGTRVPERDNAEIQNENYNNSIALFDTASLMGCSRFISIGSQAECGKCEGLVTEEYNCKPITEYGKAKNRLCKELLRKSKETNITVGWLRLFSAYGPNDYEKTMIISSTKAMLNNESVDLTLCEQNWNYIYLDDVIQLLIALAEKYYESGIFNACSNENYKLKKYVEMMKSITNSKSVLNYGARSYGKEGMVSFTPSADKVMRVLDYKHFVPFEEGYRIVLKTIKQED